MTIVMISGSRAADPAYLEAHTAPEVPTTNSSQAPSTAPAHEAVKALSSDAAVLHALEELRQQRLSLIPDNTALSNALRAFEQVKLNPNSLSSPLASEQQHDRVALHARVTLDRVALHDRITLDHGPVPTE
jgi:hypothetical protein